MKQTGEQTGKYILLAEGDGALRSRLAAALRASGYEVPEADSVSSALTLACEGRYALYILGRGLGGGLARRLAQIDRQTPMLFLTAATDDQQVEAESSWAHSYVSPKSDPGLIAQIARLLIVGGAQQIQGN